MKPRHQSIRGAVLIFALLVMVVAATVLGGIAQLAITQSVAGQSEWAAVARRIRLENSRAMARQYILNQMWRGFGSLETASLSVANLGGFSIDTVNPPRGYWLSLNTPGDDRINPFSLFGSGGFQSAWVGGSLNNGDASIPWGFQIRTRSPITAGFAFVNQRPATNNWAPARRVNLQQTDYAVGFAGLPRMPVSSVTNAAAAATVADLGFLQVPPAVADFGEIYQGRRGVTNGLVPGSTSTAFIQIDLNEFNHDGGDTPRFYEVEAATDVFFGGSPNPLPVTRLVLTNGPVGNETRPLQVVVPELNTNLTEVYLAGDNDRPVYLYRKVTNNTPALLSIRTFGGNSDFRIGMSLDGPADLNISGRLTIVGGIRTGSALTQSTGEFAFQSENNPSWEYDAIADRMMWLEDQRSR